MIKQILLYLQRGSGAWYDCKYGLNNSHFFILETWEPKWSQLKAGIAPSLPPPKPSAWGVGGIDNSEIIKSLILCRTYNVHVSLLLF